VVAFNAALPLFLSSCHRRSPLAPLDRPGDDRSRRRL